MCCGIIYGSGFWPSTDPYHLRALKNQAYFDRLAADSPDKYIDNEKEEYVSEEHKAYESLCREPQPIVSPLLANGSIVVIGSHSIGSSHYSRHCI